MLPKTGNSNESADDERWAFALSEILTTTFLKQTATRHECDRGNGSAAMARCGLCMLRHATPLSPAGAPAFASRRPPPPRPPLSIACRCQALNGNARRRCARSPHEQPDEHQPNVFTQQQPNILPKHQGPEHQGPDQGSELQGPKHQVSGGTVARARPWPCPPTRRAHPPCCEAGGTCYK